MSVREKLLNVFLWFSIIGWGIGLGAKLFDLLIVAGAWGASPPVSLALMPYGQNYPLNPGDFFQPLSAIMVLGMIGALINGWKTPNSFRIWLIIPVISFLIIWVLTPTIFWPMIGQLWSAGTGRVEMSVTDAMHLVQRWRIWDSFRSVLIAVGFLSFVRAISIRRSL